MLLQSELNIVFSFTHKICPICKILKSTNEYHQYFSAERGKYRIGNYCIICCRKTSRKRALAYYQKHKKQKKQYAKDFRANHKNKLKLKAQSQHFKTKYRNELKPCIVRDILVQKYGFKNSDLHKNPVIVEIKTNQIKLKRQLKLLQNAKK
jgi:hypothetical protein